MKIKLLAVLILFSDLCFMKTSDCKAQLTLSRKKIY